MIPASLGVSTLLATSPTAAVATSAAIPTGVRSPTTDYGDGAWIVRPGGNLGFDNVSVVIYSYGYYDRLLDRKHHFIQKYWWLRSPDSYDDYYAWIVRPSGDVNDYDDYYDVTGGSYGRI